MQGRGTPDPQTVALLVTVIVVAFVPLPIGAGGPPKLTTAPGRKPLPSMITCVLPFIDPVDAEIEVMFGAAGESA
jgi:hypothetical protein